MNPVFLAALGGLLAGLGLGWLFLRRGRNAAAEDGHLDRMADAVHDGLMVLRGREVVMANRRAGEFLGLGPTPSPERMRLALQRTPDLVAYIEDFRAGESPGERLVSVGYPRVRYLRVQGAPLDPEDPPDRGALLLTLTDVTELQRLERVRRRFTADLSHQIRTPVTAIRLLAEQLATGSGESREFAERILRETDRLKRLAEEILTLSRLEAGEEPLEIQEFAVGDLLEEALDGVYSQAERRGVTLVSDSPPRETWRADYRNLLRVLEIYLDNAIKFSPPGGEVRVAAGTEEDRCWITVTDAGPGISQEEKVQIFHRFYRGSRGTGHLGFGLGLAIAKHSMAALGGDVFVDTRVGEGSTFGLVLPRDPEGEIRTAEFGEDLW